MTDVKQVNNNLEFISRPRANGFGTFMNDGVRKIDYVLVYKENNRNENQENTGKNFEESEREERRKFFEEKLTKEGVDLERHRVEQNGEILIFVKVHVPWLTLCHYAEELQIKAPLWLHDHSPDRESSENSDDGDETHGKRRYSLWHRINGLGWSIGHLQPKKRLYDHNTVIRWPFKKKRMDRYAVRDQNTFFTEKQRIEIAYEVLQKAPNNPRNPKRRGIQLCLAEKVYETAYALHDGDHRTATEVAMARSSRQMLKENWASWKAAFHLQPLLDVRNYFGEKIAFYYGFMDVYTRMLIFPAAVGLVTFLIGIIYTAALNEEVDKICKIKTDNENDPPNHVSDPYYVADYWMCPICTPPDCHPWEMNPDGCFQYKWAFRLDNPCSFFLSAFTTLWAIIFLKFWKRQEAYLAVEWGTEDAEHNDLIVRPSYEERAPVQRQNPVTLEYEPFVPFAKRCLWVSASIMATVLVLIVACVLLIILVLARIQLYGALRPIVGSRNIDCSRWLIHGLLFIVVTFLEKAYNVIADKLTDFECPRTPKQFMNSLLWKVFIFQLLNDFIPIGYAAWIKGKTTSTPFEMDLVDEQCDGGCMGEVTELVAVLLLLRLVVGNTTEIGIPLLQTAWKRFRLHKVEENKVVPQYVKDFHLNEVELDGVYEDYMEMMVQFAFIVLFIPALPVAPFVCFLNNIAEIRVDSIKMIQTNRRPNPIRVSGIGIWNNFMDVISKAGIICNAALLAFTSDNVPRLYYMFVHNPGFGYVGFTKFSLSKINTTLYGPNPERLKVFQLDNNRSIAECWYPDFRNATHPYELKEFYWEIFSYRLVVFASYCVVFYTIMWLINTFVSNVPESVKTKINRKQYVVNKAMEAEAAIKQWSKENKMDKISRDMQQSTM